MSERPFMQLYVSDFLGDTLQLSTEQIGAYMLLLMAMWNAGGSLPDDEGKLARIARMSVKKWRSASGDLMPFFQRSEGRVSHHRLAKELQKSEGKSQLRASAGAAGGAAKALRDKEARLANASRLLQHLPEARDHIEDNPPQQSPEPAAPKGELEGLQDKLLEAAGLSDFRAERSPGLVNLAPIRGLLEANYDLDRDILPVIRDVAKRGVKPRSWQYFVDPVIAASQTRKQIASQPRAPEASQTLASWPDHKWQTALEACRDRQEWQSSFGPAPFMPGCLVPRHLLIESDKQFARIQQEQAA